MIGLVWFVWCSPVLLLVQQECQLLDLLLLCEGVEWCGL